MSRPPSIDHHALFDDVVSVVQKTHAPTAGWRAICVRAQRTLGKKTIQPLALLDLGEEVEALGDRVRKLARRAPDDVDTLVFSLFDGIEDAAGEGVYTGFHLTGRAGFDPELRWFLAAPTWVPENRYFESPSLDAIAREVTDLRGEVKKAVAHAMRFGAAALLARFAAAGLPFRLVVAFDEGDFAEISSLRTEENKLDDALRKKSGSPP